MSWGNPRARCLSKGSDDGPLNARRTIGGDADVLNTRLRFNTETTFCKRSASFLRSAEELSCCGGLRGDTSSSEIGESSCVLGFSIFDESQSGIDMSGSPVNAGCSFGFWIADDSSCLSTTKSSFFFIANPRADDVWSAFISGWISCLRLVALRVMRAKLTVVFDVKPLPLTSTVREPIGLA